MNRMSTSSILASHLRTGCTLARPVIPVARVDDSLPTDGTSFSSRGQKLLTRPRR